jgi:hypothetical protein
VFGSLLQFSLQLTKLTALELVKGGDLAVLKEIGHVILPSVWQEWLDLKFTSQVSIQHNQQGLCNRKLIRNGFIKKLAEEKVRAVKPFEPRK